MDNRQSRSEATRTALMRTAEKLIAERGIENVSIRDIVSTAGQKNESALQYHFKNINGLIRSIHTMREEQVRVRRLLLIEELLAETEKPTLRQLCTLMVQPAFELAKSKPDFRRYVRAFGHEMVLAQNSALEMATRSGGDSTQKLGALLRTALPQLDTLAYRRRMEAAVRYCSASMYHQARGKNAFKGLQADLFFHGLIDTLVGLLSAPESDESRKLARAMRDG